MSEANNGGRGDRAMAVGRSPLSLVVGLLSGAGQFINAVHRVLGVLGWPSHLLPLASHLGFWGFGVAFSRLTSYVLRLTSCLLPLASHLGFWGGLLTSHVLRLAPFILPLASCLSRLPSYVSPLVF